MSNKPNGHSLPDDAPIPRFCHLKKNFPEQEYGFDLHAEKLRGQFIGNVEESSPASSAGLCRGDRIIAVNGVSIINESHKDVVRRIREDPLQCRFVVIDEDGYHWYTNRKMSFPIVEAPNPDHSKSPLANEVAVDAPETAPDSSVIATAVSSVSAPITAGSTLKYDWDTGVVEDHVTEPGAHSEPEKLPLSEPDLAEPYPPSPQTMLPQESDDNPIEEQKPRFCKLEKSDEATEYGFNLHAEKGKGHFIGKVDPDSIADKAGLIHGYRIVGVNGILIYPRTPHKEVVALIKEDSLKTELLIASSELDAFYSEQKLSFSFSDAEIFEPQEEKIEKVPPKISTSNDSQTLVYESNGLIAGDDYADRQESLDRGQELNDHGLKENGISEARTASTEPAYNGHDKNGDVNPKPPTLDAQFLHMSASQMREHLLRHKKVDPRREQIPLREKYDIVQNL